MKTKKELMFIIATLLCLLIMAGCSSATVTEAPATSPPEEASADVEEAVEEPAEAPAEEPTEEPTEAPAEEAAEEKTLVAATHWLGSDLDPANGWNGWGLSRALVAECLATLDENLEIVPVLSDSWEVVDDTTWKFHIRQGVKFSNGEDLTAEAVMASLDRVISADSRAQSNAKLDYMEVDGEYLIYHTTEPYAALINNLTEPLFSIVYVKDDGTIDDIPVFTGPYIPVSYVPDTEISCVANPDYWDGTPGLDSFILQNISDAETRALALQAGDIQIAQKLSATGLMLFENDSDYELVGTSSLRVSYIVLNQNNEFLSDLNIRQAVSYGIDREALATIQGLGYVPCGAIFPPSANYGFDDLDKQSYDPDKAIEYLAEAGFTDTDGDGYVDKDGQNLTLTVTISNYYTLLAEAIQAQLKDIGIDLQINLMENTSEARGNGEFDLLMSNYITATTGDGERFLRQNYSSVGTDNFGFYSNEAYDAILTSLSAAFDRAERQELIIEAQQMLIDDVANLWLVAEPNTAAISSNVENMVPFSIDYYLLTKDLTIE